jgi:hypothetical protein
LISTKLDLGFQVTGITDKSDKMREKILEVKLRNIGIDEKDNPKKEKSILLPENDFVHVEELGTDSDEEDLR